jgi:hypothetical protein
VQVEAVQVGLPRPSGAGGGRWQRSAQAPDPGARGVAQRDPAPDRGAEDLGQDGRDLGKPIQRVRFAGIGLQPPVGQQPPHAVPDCGEHLGHGG